MQEYKHVHLSWIKFGPVKYKDVSATTKHPFWGHTGGWDAEKFYCQGEVTLEHEFSTMPVGQYQRIWEAET